MVPKGEGLSSSRRPAGVVRLEEQDSDLAQMK